MKKLQPWQQNKVDTLTKSGKVSVEHARSALEAVDWDVYEAAKEIVKIRKKLLTHRPDFCIIAPSKGKHQLKFSLRISTNVFSLGSSVGRASDR